ncbi:MAG: hypothetical protein HC837_15430 [Chloroflexaceae bacterium]|nr:hypothetical protein [Chloroflexaceae bacterium]
MSDDATMDVTTILEQLRAEVRAQRQAQRVETTERAAYQAIDRELMHCAEQLELTRAIITHWPLQGYTIPQRLLVLVHRVVRHSLKWYINPIADQQNAFNEVTARTLRLLIDAYREQRDLLGQLEQAESQNGTDGTTVAAALPDIQGLSDELAVLQAWVETQGQSMPMATLGDLALGDGRR